MPVTIAISLLPTNLPTIFVCLYFSFTDQCSGAGIFAIMLVTALVLLTWRTNLLSFNILVPMLMRVAFNVSFRLLGALYVAIAAISLTHRCLRNVDVGS